MRLPSRDAAEPLYCAMLSLRAVALFALAAFTLSTAASAAAEPDYEKIFQGRDGCFELFDLTRNKMIVRTSDKLCAERSSPCSTFKVPLSLMAFDAKIWKDEKEPILWD